MDVNLTDDGRADSVKSINGTYSLPICLLPDVYIWAGGDLFTYPYAHNMPMKEFVEMLLNEDHVNNDIVPYLSAQVLTHSR